MSLDQGDLLYRFGCVRLPLTKFQLTGCKNIAALLALPRNNKSFAHFLQMLYKCYTFVI